jgi:phosphoglycolate phosphatase-like HAD superfamily hydrolase
VIQAFPTHGSTIDNLIGWDTIKMTRHANEELCMPKSYLIDMDGVIVRGNELIPGADEFIERLHRREIKFLILTNNPMYTLTDLQHRLQRLGINVAPDHIYTVLAKNLIRLGFAPNRTACTIS